MSARAALGGLLVVTLIATPAVGQTISGTVFEDRDGDGIRDAGEPGLCAVDVQFNGWTDAGTSSGGTYVTGCDGLFSFSPGSGCYHLTPLDPPGWRMSQTRQDDYPEGTAPFIQPVGQPRYAKLDKVLDKLFHGEDIRITAIGDSIAYNFNFFCGSSSFWYSQQLRSRLACTEPGATFTLDEAAVKGEHTDDFLWDETNDLNNVFRLIEIQPDVVTISIIGNDLLDVDPGSGATQAQTNLAVAEVLDARQNLQEVLATLLTEVPDVDIVLNTLYDNEAYNCYTGDPTDFHRTWIPIVSRILRDTAWGQIHRVSNAEVAAEFAHEDQQGQCTGFDGLICRNAFDNIHPTQDGYEVVLEKAWEASGGVNLGPKDILGRTSMSGVDYGFLRRVKRLFPTSWEVRDGAAVLDPEAAFDAHDGGAPAAITLGAGSEELRLGGFADWYDEIQIVRVIAGVRYRTTGTVNDDFYRMEASLTGQYRPLPGHAYTPTDWNFFTPIVGGGGPDQPAENPDYPAAQVLAVPDVASYREASATLSKNPVLPPGAEDYEWPAVTHEELASTSLRVAAAPVAATPGNDPYQVELDYAWLDLYGWEKPRPAEVADLRAGKLADGTLLASFDSLAGAQRYNLYFGSLSTVRGGAYDHGTAPPAAPLCDAAVSDVGGGRLEISVGVGAQPAGAAYFLVTSHVDDVESPAGSATGGGEIDRSQSVCR